MADSHQPPSVEEEWRDYLLGRHPGILRGRQMFGWLPSSPRCKLCHSPFAGLGSLIVRRLGIRPWEKNPNLCRRCVVTMASKGPAGAEVEVSLLFADIRGSTTMAESMTAAAFSTVMNRFYEAVSAVLIAHDALIDKFVGDEVIGLFIPGIAGEDHASQSLRAARQVLAVTGHDDPDGPWAPIGIGLHTGQARVGLVGTAGGVMDFTALGDTVNTAARLAGEAGIGEIVVSEAAASSPGVVLDGVLATRELHLKGRREPVRATVLGSGARAGGPLPGGERPQ